MLNWSRVLAGRLQRSGTAEATICLFSGLLCGIHLVTWYHQFAASFGTSLCVSAAVAVAVALAFSGCLPEDGKPDRADRRHGPAFGRLGLVHLGLATWTLGFPWLLAFAWRIIAEVPGEAMVSTVTQFGCALCLAVTMLAIPTSWAARLPVCFRGREHAASEDPVARDRLSGPVSAFGYHWAGVTMGILVTALCLAPLAGIRTASWIAALSSCLISVGIAIRYRTAFAKNAGTWSRLFQTRFPASERPDRMGQVTDVRTGRLWNLACRMGDAVPAIVVFFATGATLAGLSRWMHQLALASTWIHWTQWACVIAGAALGWAWMRGRAHGGIRDRRSWLGLCLLLGAWPVVLLLAFPLFTEWSLATNSYVSQVWLVLASRVLMVAVVLLPMAAAWGALARVRADVFVFHPWAAAAGYIVMQALLMPAFGLDVALVGMVWLLAAAAIVWWIPARQWPSRRSIAVLWASAACLIALAWGCRENYCPTRSAKLLFDTGVFNARRDGTNRKLLPFLDEGRCLSLREGRHGTLTVWKYGGTQLQIRESGAPHALIGTDPRACPNSSAEVVPAVMPLVVCKSPRRALVLGLRGGMALQTCLSFPLQELVCVEPDEVAIDLVASGLAGEISQSPLEDDRVRLLRMEPAFAMACLDSRFDVVIGNADQSALAHNAGYFTREFFTRAAHCLSDDGVFAQRFDYVDYGAEPIQVVVASMLAAFRTVVAVETAPRNLLLLGTNSPQGIIRPELATRMQKPHVRDVLSQVGWDWSVLLDLPAYSHGALEKLCQLSDGKSVAANSESNGTFAFRLPLEVLRWGDKLQETHTLLNPHSGRLLEWTCQDEALKAVKRRLADFSRQRKLLHDHPDQYWLYRKTVKEQIVNEPRSQLRLVGGELPRREYHPEDKHRLRYLKALGDAAKSDPLTAADIARVAAFESPYDPLVSSFLHHEIVLLWPRCEQRDLPAELIHRLHAVYFSTATDRSVRNVSSALTFLVEYPEAEPDEARRWDHINGLLQMLKRRWEARRTLTPKSPNLVLNDIEASISAMEDAFDAMPRLSPAADVTSDEWAARQKVLETTLVRPLRSYRAKLLPSLQKKHARAKSGEQAS